MVKIAVAGGTGLVGRQTVEAVRCHGHDPLVLTRSAGVDLTTGAGLAAPLDGADAVIDVTNTPGVDVLRHRRRDLLAAEHAAVVRHHVVLSIVGLDPLPDEGHYAGKREQERLAYPAPSQPAWSGRPSSSTMPPRWSGGRGGASRRRCHRYWSSPSR